MFWDIQNVKNCKKALDVCKKSPTHKSTLPKVVQVADYKDFKKPYKTIFEINNLDVLGSSKSEKLQKSVRRMQKVTCP